MPRGRFKKPKPLGRPQPTVDLPRPHPGMTSFTAYLAAQFNRTTLFLETPRFAEVVSAVDAAYACAQKERDQFTEGRARLFSACHQGMYSAASCLARGLPLDAAAASRRALEAARTALAIKLDPDNAQRWLAYEERLARWEERRDSASPPKRLNIKYECLDGDALADESGRMFGVLSDSAVHFTPEFLSRLRFNLRKRGTELYCEYLEDDDRQIARDLATFTAVHLLILRTLDRCCDGAFFRSANFKAAFDNISEAAKRLRDDAR